MLSFRSIVSFGIVAAALTLALPATAGTLSSQLRGLVDSYQHKPELTVTRAAQATAERSSPRLFSPHVSAAGKVQVYIHYTAGKLPSQEALARLGASEVLVSKALGVIQAWIPISNLESAAALGGVGRIGLPTYAYVKGVGSPMPRATCTGVPAGLDINQDGVTAENVTPLHDQGITGAGVQIGIISNGVDCMADSQAQGYLPNEVYITPNLAGSGSEGVAMLEEVHAMAPDAELGFCGPGTSVDFLACLDDFASGGADVISDDLGFFPVTYNQSVFDSAPGVNAITTFANAHPDISLTTSAGNDQQDYYEADYSADTTPTNPTIGAISLSPSYTIAPDQYLADFSAAGRSYASGMDFGAALGQASDAAVTVTIGAGATLFGNLTWNDPAAGPYDDLDLFLLKADGTVACAPSSNDWCNSTLDQMTFAGDPDVLLPPFEFLAYTNDTGSTQTLYLVALCFDCNAHGTQPLHMKLYGFMNGGGSFNYITNGGVGGHAALKVETATAAAFSKGFVGSEMESFSDTGPFTFGDWTQAPQTRMKPDITGIDGVQVSGAGGFPSTFFGTSAASPNVGAVIVLLRSGFPGAVPDAAGWEQVILDTASTTAITNYTLNASGAGLVDAAAAASSLAGGEITATIVNPATSPFDVDPNTDVAFAATCAFQGNDPATYDWTFGAPDAENAPPAATGLAPAPVHYEDGGIYTATFTCTVGTGSGSDRTTIAVQAAATANDGNFNVEHNKPFTGDLSATGIGGEQVTGVVVTAPSHGQLTIDSTKGQFTYTPDTGYSGPDSFAFLIKNGVMDSNTATVTLTISQGSPPVAEDGTLAATEGHSASGTLVATDPDGDPLTFSIVTQPANGSVTIDDATTGAYTYTPASGFIGADSFTFKANDGTFDSNTATVTVTVAANQPPVASDGSLSTQESTAVSGTLVATDPEGDPLTFSIVTQPTNGTGTVVITNTSSGAYTYTPTSGFTGSDSFTFKANDGFADSNTATVSITVTASGGGGGGGGGGSFGGFGLGLLGALLLLALRRKR